MAGLAASASGIDAVTYTLGAKFAVSLSSTNVLAVNVLGGVEGSKELYKSKEG